MSRPRRARRCQPKVPAADRRGSSTDGKVPAPTSKLQRNFKVQAPNATRITQRKLRYEERTDHIRKGGLGELPPLGKKGLHFHRDFVRSPGRGGPFGSLLHCGGVSSIVN